ncbi:glycosyltransferase family 4 protein [Petrachloros mirabilis]
MAESNLPIRVLLINRFYYPDISATSRLLTQLTEDLADRGQEVTVITSRFSYLGGADPWPKQGQHKGVTIRRVWSTHFGRRSGAGRLVDYLTFVACAFWAVVRTQRVDWMIVLADPPMLSVLAAAARKLLKCRAGCWLQDVYPQIAIQSGLLRQSLFSGWISRLARWSLESLDRVVIVGRCMEQKLLQEGLSGRNFVRIPNWADGAQLVPLERASNSFVIDHGLQERFVLMYSGNFGIVHEVDTVENVLRCTNVLTCFTMCVIGEGVRMSHLQRIAQEEQWTHVQFLPYQPEEKLRFSLTAAHVHLVTLKPNMSGLSVPSKIYGILAAGRPAIFIGPEESEAATIIREAQCGFVIRPGDHQAVVQALISYRDDRTLIQEHGSRARAYFDAHCSRLLSTARFIELLRDRQAKPAPGHLFDPVPINGSPASTERVVYW